MTPLIALVNQILNPPSRPDPYLALSALPSSEIRERLVQIKKGICGEGEFHELSLAAQARVAMRILLGRDDSLSQLTIGNRILASREKCRNSSELG